MSSSWRVLAAALAVALPAAPATARRAAPPGATACSGCHPPPGHGGLVPPVLGRPAEEIVAAMQAYRAGQGAPTVMDRIAKGFNDEEIRAIAAWLAAKR